MSNRAPRSSLFLKVQLIADGIFDATLRNVSSSGALLKVDTILEVGQHAYLVRGGDRYEFTVVRRDNDKIGIAFDKPINVEAFRRSVATAKAVEVKPPAFRRPGVTATSSASNQSPLKSSWKGLSQHGLLGDPKE